MGYKTKQVSGIRFSWCEVANEYIPGVLIVGFTH